MGRFIIVALLIWTLGNMYYYGGQLISDSDQYAKSKVERAAQKYIRQNKDNEDWPSEIYNHHISEQRKIVYSIAYEYAENHDRQIISESKWRIGLAFGLVGLLAAIKGLAR